MLGGILKYISDSSLITRKTPEFWHKDSVTGQLLLPAMVIYFIVKRLLVKKVEAKKFPFKVICVGNAVVGGAGKTPTAIALYNILRSKNPAAKIAFVTTAYKSRLKGPLVVDARAHNSQDVGDEAMMLSHYGQTIICKDRVQTLEFAGEQKIDIAILDDGLHDRRIKKDISFLVIDGKYGFGNNLLFPAGPLRDRIDFAVEGTDQIILIGKDEKGAVKRVKHATRKIYPVLDSYIEVVSDLDKRQVYVAFAGIGRPEKFFNMLTEMDFVLADKIGFADHHFYTSADIETLENTAAAQKAKLICTEKDFVKLPPEFAAKVDCVKIALRFETKEINEVL